MRLYVFFFSCICVMAAELYRRFGTWFVIPSPGSVEPLAYARPDLAVPRQESILSTPPMVLIMIATSEALEKLNS